MPTFVALKLRSLESNHLKNGYLQRGLSRANIVVKKKLSDMDLLGGQSGLMRNITAVPAAAILK